MDMEKTDSLVIRLADFSESSRVVTLFTREFGKISVLAKGAKRLKGPFESALDLLSRCQIVFIRKSTSSLDLLTEAKLVHAFRPAGGNLMCLYAGYYIAELLNGLTEDYDPHSHLFDISIDVLGRLESTSEALDEVMKFEATILKEIGQLPDFNTCVVCSESVQSGRRYGFWLSQGGLICGSCSADQYSDSRISAGAVAALRFLANSNRQQLDRLQVSSAQLSEVRQVFTGLVSQMLGRRPKMLRYLAAT